MAALPGEGAGGALLERDELPSLGFYFEDQQASATFPARPGHTWWLDGIAGTPLIFLITVISVTQNSLGTESQPPGSSFQMQEKTFDVWGQLP